MVKIARLEDPGERAGELGHRVGIENQEDLARTTHLGAERVTRSQSRAAKGLDGERHLVLRADTRIAASALLDSFRHESSIASEDAVWHLK
jgi:hypothetical protein